MVEKDVGKTWKEYFEDLYNMDTKDQVTVNMCCFYGNRRGNCFGREPVSRTSVMGNSK